MSAADPQLKAGGTLVPDKHLYISRPEDGELLRLLSASEYCNVLSSRQMGKSSLMAQTAFKLAARGIRFVAVDVAGELGSALDAGDWYDGLIHKIASDLDLDLDVAAWSRQAGGTHNQRFLQFFREEVAGRIQAPVVVFLDEIDSTLKLAFTDDLFTAIRTMYNERAFVPAYRQITFCLLGVATPNELIKDRRTTAYNVGRTLELRDFDPAVDDLAPLARALSGDSEVAQSLLSRVLSWTNGHPYLTLRFCDALSAGASRRPEEVDAYAEAFFSDLDKLGTEVHFQQILRFLATRLTDELATLDLYERILRGKREPDQPALAHMQLKLSGLVKRGPQGLLAVRNRLYERLFDLEWVRQTRPRQTIRKLRWAGASLLLALLLTAGAAVYDHFMLKPRRDAFRKALTQLGSTSDEALAKQLFAQLAADGGHAVQVRKAYQIFWATRANLLDQRALARLANKDVDQALILGAAAAVKRGGELNPKLASTFDQRHYARLLVTVRGNFYFGSPSLSPDGKELMAGYALADKDIGIWDAQSGRLLRWIAAFVDVVESPIFSSDGSRILAGTFRSGALIENVKPPARRLLLAARGRISGVAFSPNGQMAATSSLGGVELWETATGKRRGEISAGWVRSVAFSPDGHRLAIAGLEESGVLAVDSGRLLFGLPTPAYSAVFSHDGSAVAIAGDGFASAFDSATGKHLLFHLSLGQVPATVAFSPDDRLIAIGGARVNGGARANPIHAKALLGNTREGYGLRIDDFKAHEKLLEVMTDITVDGVAFASQGRRVFALSESSDIVQGWDVSALETSPAEPSAASLVAASPERFWQSLQVKLNLTLGPGDEVIDLWPTGPHALHGLREALGAGSPAKR